MIGFINKMFGSNTDLTAIAQDGAIILDVRTVGEYQQGTWQVVKKHSFTTN